MVVVAQLVRASDCGSESRRFESGLPPNNHPQFLGVYFLLVNNIKNIIENSPLGYYQYQIILICFFLNIIDGMDVLIISYTAPIISLSMNFSSQELGIVLALVF